MANGNFQHSLPGRLACITVTVALAAAGGVAIVGPSPSSFGLIGLASGVCVVSGIFAVLLATEEFVLHAVVMFVPTTILAAVYVAALLVVRHAGKLAGIVLLAMSAVPLVATLGVSHGSHGEPSSPRPPSTPLRPLHGRG
jgi:hypothetical protein